MTHASQSLSLSQTHTLAFPTDAWSEGPELRFEQGSSWLEGTLGPSHIGSIQYTGQVPLARARAHQLASRQPWDYLCFLSREHTGPEWLL